MAWLEIGPESMGKKKVRKPVSLIMFRNFFGFIILKKELNHLIFVNCGHYSYLFSDLEVKCSTTTKT